MLIDKVAMLRKEINVTKQTIQEASSQGARGADDSASDKNGMRDDCCLCTKKYWSGDILREGKQSLCLSVANPCSSLQYEFSPSSCSRTYSSCKSRQTCT